MFNDARVRLVVGSVVHHRIPLKVGSILHSGLEADSAPVKLAQAIAKIFVDCTGVNKLTCNVSPIILVRCEYTGAKYTMRPE